MNSSEENEKLKLFISIAQDTAFLFFWGFATWGLNKFIAWINLDTMVDKIVLTVLVWVSSISTIILAIAFLVKDTIKIVIKTWLEIKKDLAKLRNEENE